MADFLDSEPPTYGSKDTSKWLWMLKSSCCGLLYYSMSLHRLLSLTTLHVIIILCEILFSLFLYYIMLFLSFLAPIRDMNFELCMHSSLKSVYVSGFFFYKLCGCKSTHMHTSMRVFCVQRNQTNVLLQLFIQCSSFHHATDFS